MQNTKIPIFVISFNRGEMLKKVIQSYKKLNLSGQIIVHDNGSDDIKTMQILEQIKSDGILVYRNRKIKAVNDLENINKSINRFFRFRKRCDYVVTDCDIDMSDCDVDALAVYRDVLHNFPNIQCAGPMLMIKDIPKSYPLYNRVMNRHIDQFWHKKPIIRKSKDYTYAYQECRIDTTFAVHRANHRFKRLKTAIRVYEPYEARHLDWYTDCNFVSQYRVTSLPDIAHWDNQSEHEKYKSEKLKFTNYNIVSYNNNSIIVKKQSI